MVKPIGVSTQFVILDGIVWNLLDERVVVENSAHKSGYSSPNAYLNKSGGKYAKNIVHPLNYSFVFVLAMIVGAFVARKMQHREEKAKIITVPTVCLRRFGSSSPKRYLVTFLGGLFVLFGSRLAGGCTSGHMMSGMMQTSLSGYLFALGAFAVAIPMAILIYGREE
ncbi:hypothetical membrane protein [Desulfotalea psychrophila LSv54]|uniref:Hypothetical membrane protein n=1 Tax=Desulfotalea psychrophila (strain LSv54 / DSM 12343) TaxID=177439 RepID=Q6ALX5_DESPS|nr:hypothetical membrane protein [Desulfotalea psychrophila LSv54]